MTDSQDNLAHEVQDLLAAAGKRPQRKLDHRAPKEAVLTAWREAIDQASAPAPTPRRQPTIPRWAQRAAAALAGMALLFLFVRWFDSDQVELLVVTAVLLGEPQVTTIVDDATNEHHGSAGIGFASSIVATEPVALQLADGGELRLAAGTTLRFDTADRWFLERGKLYLDSKRDAQRGISSRSILTPFGAVSEIGTQYEITVATNPLVHSGVRVRSGTVRIDSPTEQRRLEEGNALQLTSNGWSKTSSGRGPDAWRWVIDAAPSFHLEGATLSDYLAWLKSETDWQVSLSTDAERLLESTLHGDFGAIKADQSLDVVAAMLGLEVAGERDSLQRRLEL